MEATGDGFIIFRVEYNLKDSPLVILNASIINLAG